MFTDEQPPDYSFPPRFDVYPDDFLEIEFDAVNFDDDLFDSKGEKIKEAKLLIDQLDLPCGILSEYDSFDSHDFSRDDDLPSPDNEDKDFDPPFYELLVFKEVPNSMRLLPFSFENEEKVFKPGIYTSEKVHYSCFLPELSHPERAEVYYECKEPFKSLKCLWVRSKSIAATWLEKVGFVAASTVLKPERLKVDRHAASTVLKLERLKVDRHGMSEPMSYYLID
nr:hypothetical protein [Tanacetum cinerariifolium]